MEQLITFFDECPADILLSTGFSNRRSNSVSFEQSSTSILGNVLEPVEGAPKRTFVRNHVTWLLSGRLQ